MNEHQIIVNLLDLLVEVRPLVAQHARLFADVRRMVVQHRNPTEAEWAALFAGFAASSDRLEVIVRELAARHVPQPEPPDLAAATAAELDAEAILGQFDVPDEEPFGGE